MGFVNIHKNHCFYYRCEETGNPSKVHIKNSAGNVLCGWIGDEFCQEYEPENWSVHILDVCKKRLNNYEKQITKQK